MFFTVKQNHVVLIERLGKYARTAKEGIRFHIPFLEKIKEYPEWIDREGYPSAHKEVGQMELSVQQIDTVKRQTQTRDSVTVEADAAIYWRITDPVKAAYEVDILPKSIEDSALNALRGQIGKLELADLIANRQVINEAITADLLEISKSWGVVITRVEVQSIDYNDDTAKAMLQEMEAERKKRAQIFEAQGLAESILLEANARAEAIKVIADAESIYLEKLGGTEGALNIILAQKYLNGMETITKNPADKVFIPNSYQTLIGLSDDTSGG
jgi:regulator of protease activity HflC (stomatin/prohibitin superfamily)